jgi:RNA polymerase sigma factor (sigma-70 family)
VTSTDPPDCRSLPVHSKEWWAAIYRLTHDAAWRGAMSVFNREGEVRDATDVEDVVQDVYKELMETEGIDNDTCNPAGVVYRRSRQRALDRTTRGRRSVLTDPDERGEEETGYNDVEDADLAERIGAHAWDNWHRLNATERKVWGLVSRNPNLSQAEIAALAELSEGHVSTMLKKDIPRKLMTGFLNQQEGGD